MGYETHNMILNLQNNFFVYSGTGVVIWFIVKKREGV
jgi:hypothetical protein